MVPRVLTNDPPEYAAEAPVANWVWLAEPAGTRAALCLGDACDRMAEALSRRFDRTWVVEERPAECARLRMRLAPMAPAVRLVHGSPGVLPFDRRSFDCITLHGLFDWWPARGARAARAAARAALLARMRSLLRPDGSLTVAHGNGPDVPSHDEMTRALRAAGFRHLRCYYAHPSCTNPRFIIPRTRRATLACERALFRDMRQGPMRRTLANLGLHRALYGAALYLAQR